MFRCDSVVLLIALLWSLAGSVADWSAQAGTPSQVSTTDEAKEKPGSGEQPSAKYTVETLRGRVVFAAEAMARLHGVKSVAEAKDRTLALETTDGELYPLVEDVRGRAFRADEKLRGFDIELLVRHYAGSPLRQVIGVYAIQKDGKYEVDYWCDVCAIAMYELKPCECCQAMNHMRLRRVEDSVGNDAVDAEDGR